MSIGNYLLVGDCYNKFVLKFDEWLWIEYQKFAKIPGSRRVKSQAEFARYLGVTTGSLSRWLNGDNPPGYDSVITLAQKLGNEVYAVTGFTPPETTLSNWFSNLPSDERSRTMAAMLEISEQASANGIDIDSPEGAALANDVLRRYGL